MRLEKIWKCPGNRLNIRHEIASWDSVLTTYFSYVMEGCPGTSVLCYIRHDSTSWQHFFHTSWRGVLAKMASASCTTYVMTERPDNIFFIRHEGVSWHQRPVLHTCTSWIYVMNVCLDSKDKRHESTSWNTLLTHRHDSRTPRQDTTSWRVIRVLLHDVYSGKYYMTSLGSTMTCTQETTS